MERHQEQESEKRNQATEPSAATARVAGAFDVLDLFDGSRPARSTEGGTTADTGRTTSEQSDKGRE